MQPCFLFIERRGERIAAFYFLRTHTHEGASDFSASCSEVEYFAPHIQLVVIALQ